MNMNPLCTALALYQFDLQKVDIKGLFYYLEEWFNGLNCPPKYAGITGEKPISTSKLIQFKNVKKKLEKGEFQGVESIGLYCPTEQANTWALDSRISASIYCRHQGSFDLYFSHEVHAYSQSYMEGLLQDITRYIPASYGIVYHRELKKGPGLYADGMVTGLPREYNSQTPIGQERECIAKWFNTYSSRIFQLGDLRDVYPLNFLSAPHLKRDVDGTPLKEWILSEPDHGDLKPVTQTLWSWHIPDEKIPQVREKLRETGILKCI